VRAFEVAADRRRGAHTSIFYLTPERANFIHSLNLRGKVHADLVRLENSSMAKATKKPAKKAAKKPAAKKKTSKKK
jgi:hypothetical protein